MPHRIIQTDADMESLGALLAGLKRPFTVEWRQGKDRSLDQNALQFKWATEAAQQRGDMTPIEVQKEWKLRYGVPLLRSESDSFLAFSDKALRPLNYEERLAAMEYVPITSIMTVKQMTMYLETVQRECLQQGIRLTDPAA